MSPATMPEQALGQMRSNGCVRKIPCRSKGFEPAVLHGTRHATQLTFETGLQVNSGP